MMEIKEKKFKVIVKPNSIQKRELKAKVRIVSGFRGREKIVEAKS